MSTKAPAAPSGPRGGARPSRDRGAPVTRPERRSPRSSSKVVLRGPSPPTIAPRREEPRAREKRVPGLAVRKPVSDPEDALDAKGILAGEHRQLFRARSRGRRRDDEVLPAGEGTGLRDDLERQDERDDFPKTVGRRGQAEVEVSAVLPAGALELTVSTMPTS